MRHKVNKRYYVKVQFEWMKEPQYGYFYKLPRPQTYDRDDNGKYIALNYKMVLYKRPVLVTLGSGKQILDAVDYIVTDKVYCNDDIKLITYKEFNNFKILFAPKTQKKPPAQGEEIP